MERKLTIATGIIHAVLLMACMLVAACDRYNYVDELQGLGGRVETLEGMELKVNEQMKALDELIRTVEAGGYVTKVEKNADGTSTITFNDGRQVTLRPGRQGADGHDGQEADLDIGVRQGEDGTWYWTVNGQWLTDEQGNRMEAGASDGADGRDGKDGQDGRDGKTLSETGASVPQMRINPDTRHWEVSTDGGRTWTDTGSSADGSNGRDGSNDIFADVKVSSDGKSITFILRDGRTFTVPIM